MKDGGGKDVALKNAKESFLKRANEVDVATGEHKGKTAVGVYKEDYENNKPKSQ